MLIATLDGVELETPRPRDDSIGAKHIAAVVAASAPGLE
jgi:hypothetical protein